jgi:serine/threonine protein kinase
VLIDAKPSVRKQILRELQIMHDCNSNYIISFWGAFIADPNICICMEFMDKGSLDGIYKKIGPIDIDVVRHIALAVLEGLTYLYDVHRIIHRGTSALFFTHTYFCLVLRSKHSHDILPSQTSSHQIYCATPVERSRSVILVFRASSSTLSPTHLWAHPHT